MPGFPKKEAGIIALAERMIAGLLVNSAIYPNPSYPAQHPVTGIKMES